MYMQTDLAMAPMTLSFPNTVLLASAQIRDVVPVLGAFVFALVGGAGCVSSSQRGCFPQVSVD